MKSYTSIKDVDNKILDSDLSELLFLLERINPCRQQYFVMEDTLVVTYMHKLNLFNFRKVPSLSLSVRIIGLPVSLSMPGIFGNGEKLAEVLSEIKGLSLVLNWDFPLPGGGRTLSNFVFDNGFATFSDYLKSLRSGYRRRIRQTLERGEAIQVKKLESKDFKPGHYQLYKAVYDRSPYPLECLPIEFFRESKSDLFEFMDPNEEVLAFVQLVERGDSLIFMFCGFEKRPVDLYDLYNNMLLFILKEGIRRKVKTINFGQTSEVAKLRLGCREVDKYLYLYHGNSFVRGVLKWLTPYFSYERDVEGNRAFKVKP